MFKRVQAVCCSFLMFLQVMSVQPLYANNMQEGRQIVAVEHSIQKKSFSDKILDSVSNSIVDAVSAVFDFAIAIGLSLGLYCVLNKIYSGTHTDAGRKRGRSSEQFENDKREFSALLGLAYLQKRAENQKFSHIQG